MWKKYMCTYRYNGAQWVFYIHALSIDEARARLWHLQFATLDGEVKAEIPAGPLPTAWIVKAICWVRNFFFGGVA